MHPIADAAKKDMRCHVLELDFRSKACEKDVSLIQFEYVLEFIKDNAKAAFFRVCRQHVHHLFNRGNRVGGLRIDRQLRYPRVAVYRQYRT